MKKYVLLCLLLFPVSLWADQKPPYVDSVIEPATSASQVTISAAGRMLRNCLTSVSVISNSTYTFRILDGTTTTYALLMPASSGLVKDWERINPFCADPNAALIMSVDNGTYSINYDGLVVR